MSEVVRPRKLVHRGVVDASAFFIARAPSEIRARERIVALAGSAEVHRAGEGWIVRLRAPISIACAAAPGVPLVGQGKGKRVLAGAPLDDDELEALVGASSQGAFFASEASEKGGELEGARLRAPSNVEAFVVVRGGEAKVVLSEGLEDPSTWLDVGAFAIAEVETLGVVPPPPVAVLAPVRDARSALGAPKPAPELAKIVEAIRARAEAAKARAGKSIASGGAGAASGEGRRGFFDALTAMLAAFASLFGGGGRARPAPAPAAGSGDKPSRALATVPQEPAGPSWIERARARMRDAIARMLVRTRLASFLGKKHAEYLSRMLQLFEDGDIDEALRYAIPLGEGEDADGLSSPALLPPTPRSALDIRLGGLRAQRSLGLGGDLFDHLKKKYRAAFEKLDAAGRHKDAAFVLVELLGANEEAVSYLERHRLYRLAAEIAEAKKLAPGLVVRQWMLAGERERALAVARLHGAFADAVVRLEASHADQAKALRMLWADSLAEGGAFAAAIEVVWKIPEARPLALRWIDRAIDVGGPVGAKMLARKVKLVPDAFAEVRDAALTLLDDGSADARAMRSAFGDELAVAPATPEARVLARPTARVLASEGADAALLERVVVATSDLVLRAELAATSRVLPASLGASSTSEIVRAAADRGAIAATDAALLPGGRVLVALGEAGARILAPDGRTLARFLEPAHRLVVSDHGDRAIALAPRGKATWRLARIDLVGRRVRTWRDARFGVFAPDFDGATWLVGDGDSLHAIDVLDDAWRALWSTAERGATITAIARAERTMTVLLERAALENAKAGSHDLWTFDVAGYVLRRRNTLPYDGGLLLRSPTPEGAMLDVLCTDYSKPGRTLRRNDGSGWKVVHELETAPTDGALLGDGWTLLTFSDGHAVTLRADRHDFRSPLRIVLEAVTRVTARRHGPRLLVHDDRGRILLVDLEDRRVIHEWRVS